MLQRQCHRVGQRRTLAAAPSARPDEGADAKGLANLADTGAMAEAKHVDAGPSKIEGGYSPMDREPFSIALMSGKALPLS